MPTIGSGVREMRIHTDLEHRVFYVATFSEAVYVLHAFEKRTRKTPPRELQLARERLGGLLMRRRGTAMPTKNRIKVTKSSGNVFRDLGFPPEEAEHLLIRADLLIQVEKAIASKRLKQAQVAKILHVTDTLIDMLARLGIHVQFVVKPSRRRNVA